PVEEDTPKKWDTTGTVFIQGPSIVLPVWRCIMFNDSYLRACMKLWIVQKIRFSLLESGWTKAWCPGLVSRPSAVSLFIIPTGPTALDSEPRGRRYVKNMGHNRNR